MEDNLITQVLKSTSLIEEKKIEAKMLIAAKIYNALKNQNISKKKLMDLLGKKHQSEISKWLSGTHNFTTETLVDIENVLNIKLLNIEPIEQQPINYKSINLSIPYIPFLNSKKKTNWINNNFEQTIMIYGDC